MTDRDRLIDILLAGYVKCEREFGAPVREQLADYLLANGVIVLPCKVGDTVYRIYPDCDKHRKCCSDYCKQCNKEKARVEPQIMNDITEILSLKHLFNKEIFLEKEIAEEKLKEINI